MGRLTSPMQDTNLTGIVRAYFGAYESENRAVAETLLADDFTFTSPNDDAIDRATYFERCWPQSDIARDQQIEKIVNHARTLGMTRMAVLYQDLAIGTSGWAVAEEAGKADGKLQLSGVKSGTAAEALAAAAAEVAKLEPQGVLVVGAPRFMADGVAALRKTGVSQSLFVLSYVPAGLLVKLAGPQGARGVGIAQTYPNPNGIVLPLQREFQAAMKASFPDVKQYTSFHLEGYLSARTVVEAMRRSKEKDITPAAIQRALHAGGEYDFGGYRVDFSKGNVGSQWVDIGVVNHEGKLRY